MTISLHLEWPLVEIKPSQAAHTPLSGFEEHHARGDLTESACCEEWFQPECPQPWQGPRGTFPRFVWWAELIQLDWSLLLMGKYVTMPTIRPQHCQQQRYHCSIILKCPGMISVSRVTTVAAKRHDSSDDTGAGITSCSSTDHDRLAGLGTNGTSTGTGCVATIISKLDSGRVHIGKILLHISQFHAYIFCANCIFLHILSVSSLWFSLGRQKSTYQVSYLRNESCSWRQRMQNVAFMYFLHIWNRDPHRLRGPSPSTSWGLKYANKTLYAA